MKGLLTIAITATIVTIIPPEYTTWIVVIAFFGGYILKSVDK